MAWEIYLRNLSAHEIEAIITKLFELGKNAGKMEMNAKRDDIVIDKFNPLLH